MKNSLSSISLVLLGAGGHAKSCINLIDSLKNFTIKGILGKKEEVGKDFAVTRERIRQIEVKALKKLRHPSRSNKLQAFFEKELEDLEGDDATSNSTDDGARTPESVAAAASSDPNA